MEYILWIQSLIYGPPQLIPPGQNGRHFTDIFKCIFVNEKVQPFLKISLKFVPKGPIDNNQALV